LPAVIVTAIWQAEYERRDAAAGTRRALPAVPHPGHDAGQSLSRTPTTNILRVFQLRYILAFESFFFYYLLDLKAVLHFRVFLLRNNYITKEKATMSINFTEEGIPSPRTFITGYISITILDI
jgi:hypothetical protein